MMPWDIVASQSKQAQMSERRKSRGKKLTFPESKELGAEIGGGWRAIMSQEGSKRSLWDLGRVRGCLAEGLAEYDGASGVLT